MPAIDLSNYTIDSATDVSVATFRNQVEHLEQVVNCDWHSCVGPSEKARCVDIAKRVGAELVGMTCKRATIADWDRRERAIERSCKLILGFK